MFPEETAVPLCSWLVVLIQAVAMQRAVNGWKWQQVWGILLLDTEQFLESVCQIPHPSYAQHLNLEAGSCMR